MASVVGWQPLGWLGHAVAAFEAQWAIEQQLPAEAGAGLDASAGKMAVVQAAAQAASAAQAVLTPMRMVSATLQARQQRRFSSVHVAARVAQVDEVAERAEAAHRATAQALAALQSRLAGRLWLPPELVAGWTGAHAQTLARLDSLLARLAATRAGFAALPQDPDLPATAPPRLPVMTDDALAPA